MAITSVGWELHVTLVDSGLNIANKSYELVAADATEAATSAAAILAALDAVTDAAIKGYRIAEVWAETGVFSLPGDCEIENQALLLMRLDGNPFKKATTTIPAPAIGIFNNPTGSGRNVVDTADAAVIAYRTLYQSPGNVATISDGETVDVLESGHRIHRQSNKG